jgi:uncharacterized protein YerC
MNVTLRRQLERTLASALLNLETEEDARGFLSEFLTEREFLNLTKRFGVVYFLMKKKGDEDIKNNLKVGNLAILEGRKLLNRGSVKKILRRVDADEWAEKWAQKIRNITRGFLAR